MTQDELREKVLEEQSKIDAANKRIRQLNEEYQKELNNDIQNYEGKYIKYNGNVDHVYMYVEKQKIIDNMLFLEGFNVTQTVFRNPSLCSSIFYEYGSIKISIQARNIDDSVVVITKEEFCKKINSIVEGLQKKVDRLKDGE